MVLNKGKASAPTQRRNLIAFTNPESIISEQYRTIRTNLQFICGDKKSSTLLITSPGKWEGKSTTAANIAVSMVQQKEKVLLVDANLRNPSIHHIFKTANTEGLNEVLAGTTNLEKAIISSGIDGLEILPSGEVPSNPAELLGSPMMKELLENISPDYDFVLIDSPPVLEVTDTKIIANLSDGVVLVVRQDKTHIEIAYETKKVLEYAKANIVGIILNDKT